MPKAEGVWPPKIDGVAGDAPNAGVEDPNMLADCGAGVGVPKPPALNIPALVAVAPKSEGVLAEGGSQLQLSRHAEESHACVISPMQIRGLTSAKRRRAAGSERCGGLPEERC